MSTFGWPVQYFKSLPELVGVMRDAIAGKIFIVPDLSSFNLFLTPQATGSFSPEAFSIAI